MALPQRKSRERHRGRRRQEGRGIFRHRPVEERHRIDEMRLDGWMRDHVEGYQGPLTVLQFKGGQSNPTYRLDTPARSYVMRRKSVRQIAAVGACGRPRVPRHRGARQAGLSGRESLCAVHRRRRDRRGLLHHVDGRGPGVLGSDAAEPDAGGSPQNLHQQDRDAGETAHLRSAGHRARRFRQARQLFRPPGRPLDQAIPRLGDPAHSGVRKARRMAAENRAAAAARVDRPWRLSARQHDLPCRPSRGCRRCWTGNCRRSAIPWRISLIS